MMKKIINHRYYNLFIILIEVGLIIEMGVKFLVKDSVLTDGLNDFWIDILISFIILVSVFVSDIILCSYNGILKYVNSRDEEGFQMKRYANISIISSSAVSLVIWGARTIHIINQGAPMGGGVIIAFLIMFIPSMFVLFWLMLLVFFIGNKIADKNMNK